MYHTFRSAKSRTNVGAARALYYYQKGRAAGLAMPAFMQADWPSDDCFKLVHSALLGMMYIDSRGGLTGAGRAVYEEQVKMLERNIVKPVDGAGSTSSGCSGDPGEEIGAEGSMGTQQDQRQPATQAQAQQQNPKKNKKSHNKKKKK